MAMDPDILLCLIFVRCSTLGGNTMHGVMHEMHAICNCWGYLVVHVGMQMTFILLKFPFYGGVMHEYADD